MQQVFLLYGCKKVSIPVTDSPFSQLKKKKHSSDNNQKKVSKDQNLMKTWSGKKGHTQKAINKIMTQKLWGWRHKSGFT